MRLQMCVTDRETCVIFAVLCICAGEFHGKWLYEFFMARSVTEFGRFKRKKKLMTEPPRGSQMSCVNFPNRHFIHTQA